MTTYHFIVAFRAHPVAGRAADAHALPDFVDRVFAKRSGNVPPFRASISPGGLILALEVSVLPPVRALLEAARDWPAEQRRFGLSAALDADYLTVIPADHTWYGPNFEGAGVVRSARALAELPPGSLSIYPGIPWSDGALPRFTVQGKAHDDRFDVLEVRQFFHSPAGSPPPAPPPTPGSPPVPPGSIPPSPAVAQPVAAQPAAPQPIDPQPSRPVRSNPYRSLAVFDIEDGGAFFGRTSVIREAVDVLVQRFSSAEPAAVRIEGESGTGKSSLLRGGILHTLATKHPDRFHVVALRPTDFHGDDGRPAEVASKLIKKIFQATKLAVPHELLDDGNRPAVIRTAVSQLTERLQTSQRKLVIGLDQFEEIVDELEHPRRGPAWRPLLQLVETAVQGAAIGLVFTLESSRVELFRRLLTSTAFRDSHCIPIESDLQFLREVIDRPFRDAGFRLHNDIIEELRRHVRDLLAADRNLQWTGSVLPLLSVKLTRLFDEVESSVGGRVVESRSLASMFGPNVLRSDLPGDLGFEQEIANLAHSAWREAVAQYPLRFNRGDIDYFLTPLVRLTSAGSRRLQLTTIGIRAAHQERSIDDSFREHRLLVLIGGRQRLIHESVIHEWPAAASWLTDSLGTLEAETWFARAALEWDAAAARPDAITVGDDSVDMAAAILDRYSRTMMSFDLLDAEHQLLLRYCLAVFRTSNTPLRPVPGSAAGKVHVHVAAQCGLVDLLARFAERAPDSLETRTSVSQRTSIYHAAYAQRGPEAVEFLLNHGVDATAPDAEGWTPLDAAIQSGSAETFQLLLPSYRTPSAISAIAATKETTTLDLCAVHDVPDMARQLIRECRLDPRQVNTFGRTPMHTAAFSGSLAAFKLFRDETDVTDLADGWSSLHFAAVAGHVEIVKALIEDEDFAAMDLAAMPLISPLSLAAQNRRADVVAALLQTERPDWLRRDGEPFLHLAIAGPPDLGEEYEASREAALRTVQVLLAHPDTDPNERSPKDGKTPFERAAHHVRIRRALLEHPRFDVSSPLAGGKTALMIAAELRDRNLVERILARSEANVQFTSNGVSTTAVLMRAQMTDLVQRLVATGRVDPWTAETPLLPIAVEQRDRELIAALLSHVASAPGRMQHALDRALLVAIVQQDLDLVRRLLDLGASPDALDAEGRPVLVAALAIGRMDLLEPLLAKADTSLGQVDDWGRSSLSQVPDALRHLLEQRLRHSVARTLSFDAIKSLPAAPFYRDVFVASPRRADLLAMANAIAPGALPVTGQTDVSESALAFYRDAHLVRLSDPSWQPPVPKYYLVADSKVTDLGAHPLSLGIRDLNQRHLTRLTEHNVLAYLAFFCYFARGDWPLLIIDRPDHPLLPARSPTTSADDAAMVRAAVNRVFRAPQVLGTNDAGAWQVSAIVYYDTELFSADFLIAADGAVDMVSDMLLRSDLPAGFVTPQRWHWATVD